MKLPTIPPEPVLEGATLGPWRLERLLGEGAMGRVYAARHQDLGRRAAVKVLKLEHAASEEVARRFRQEALAQHAIDDPHVVRVHDYARAPGPRGGELVYCVMEQLEGEPLSAVLDRGPVPVRRAARIARQLAQGLAAAHRAGVVHRDVTPENVFLHRPAGGGPEVVKLLDFGVAKAVVPLGEGSPLKTAAGVVVGTPEYLSPEQVQAHPVDRRTDLHAVGLVLYELLAGAPPFHGGTFARLAVEIATVRAPPLPACTPAGEAIPPGLAGVVARCLEKAPEDRYASAEALAEALAPWAEGVEVAAAAEPLDEAQLKAVRPTLWPRVVVVGLGVALVLGLGVLALMPREAPTVRVEKVEEPEAVPAKAAVAAPPAVPAARAPERVRARR